MDDDQDYSLVLPDDEQEATTARRPIRVYVNGVEQRPAQAIGGFLNARTIRAASDAPQVPKDDEDAVVGGRVTVSVPFCTGTGID